MLKKRPKPRRRWNSTDRKCEENLAQNLSSKMYLKVRMCLLYSVAPDQVIYVRKDMVFTSFANVHSSLMAALILVESFQIETLYVGDQSNVCPRFSVQQMQHGPYLLSTTFLNL